MIAGLGTDLLELSRIYQVLRIESSGQGDIFDGSNIRVQLSDSAPVANKLVQRILTATELDVFETRWSQQPRRGVAFLATRFAAKEAFSKAMGCGVGQQFSFQDLSVLNGKQGEPEMHYSARLQEWLSERDLCAHVSLSDQPHYVTATVILSQKSTKTG